jgi:uncharacterized protein YegP (UPF0339 family)
MKIEIYRSTKNGQLGWRLIAMNGKKIACGGETYHNKKDLLKVVNSLALTVSRSKIIDTTTK